MRNDEALAILEQHCCTNELAQRALIRIRTALEDAEDEIERLLSELDVERMSVTTPP